MNWPPLSTECTQAIAAVLAEVGESKPTDLVEHVAKCLELKSGLGTEEFRERFEECKRRPVTYVLEEKCPAGQDPMSWVPMRYNDDTIRLKLRQHAFNLVIDMLSDDPIMNSKDLVERATVAYPETMYLRGCPEELIASQTFKALYLGCSSNPHAIEQGLDDADPMLAFQCSKFMECAREYWLQPSKLALIEGSHLNDATREDESIHSPLTHDVLDALIVCSLLYILGKHQGFRRRYGGGASSPEQAALHAIAHETDAMPSILRLSVRQKELVVASLRAHIPLELLVSTEAVPIHFYRVKETVVPIYGCLKFWSAHVTVAHVVHLRSVQVEDKAVDLIRLAIQCAATLEKYQPQRSYELLLKKRAERHAWRLVKDDLSARTVVRLCCLAGREDADSWPAMKNAFEGLPEKEQGILTAELGRKDGIVESPVFQLSGGPVFLGQACSNASLTAGPALSLLAHILEDAARSSARLHHHSLVHLRLDSLGPYARDYRGESAVAFKDTPFLLQELLQAGEVVVKLAGA